MKYRNVAFIPLRGGSKSIPLKNIKPINGRPLVYWVLDMATSCKYIDKVFVSTDSQSIKDVVESYNSEKIIVIDRDESTARDNSTTESAMLEFASKYDFVNIVLIQATSPLLQIEDLENGFKMVLENKFDSVLSVVRQKRFIWSRNEKEYYPVNYNYMNRPMRQSFEGFLVENGAFYITSKESLLKSKNRISGNIGIVEMDEDSYFEIDELSDWIIVEKLLERKKKNDYFKLKQVFKNIKLLITDSDGVLTDGGMYYSEVGDELKRFNTKDGMGVQLLREVGIKTVIITGEKVDLVKRRAEKLGIDEIYMGIKEKAPLVREIAKKHNLKLEEIAYLGDDINDLDSIKIVGLGCCVADAISIVKENSKYITSVKGGQGALREVADLIIKYR
ncbi:acylneuraminate cytidylyltransferase [Proteiniborus sp. MB09-C3]|uniref:acylneuraminate cytidylyltransferase n=1 Tax=Proteiniborus sp. MB09-C3 TaxID=3050072 RepID=UPI002552431F|nr:acylneuraminate cytidylyltransferase [Proteiniborus sp. MB09-C3]WIV12042.1 HAD hydrolase family protein [Proteiniborus sp. MB09-C3]